MCNKAEQQLSEKDVADIDGRLAFLRDILEDAARQYDVEDVRSELELNLHIYLAYFEAAGNEELGAWQIHQSWFDCHKSGKGANPELLRVLKAAYQRPKTTLRAELDVFLECLDFEGLIHGEADAVIWMSFLDYSAPKLLCRLSADRMAPLFGRAEK